MVSCLRPGDPPFGGFFGDPADLTRPCFGNPADLEGPVALRPQITLGLPLSENPVTWNCVEPCNYPLGEILDPAGTARGIEAGFPLARRGRALAGRRGGTATAAAPPAAPPGPGGLRTLGRGRLPCAHAWGRGSRIGRRP